MKKSRRKILPITVAIILVLLAIPYYAFDQESRTLNNAARKELGGDYIQLSDGYTHYQWSGSETGPVVILVHGFSTPLFNWDKLVPGFSAAGFRVLRYDLFGRGYSDRPHANYDENLFDRQLLELINTLQIKAPVSLVGLSMGGAICTIFTARHPEMVSRLGLMAPAGFPVNIPFTGKLVRYPVIGDYLMKAVGDKTLVKSVKKALYRPETVPEYIELFKRQMVYKGYKRAIVSTLRYFDLNNQKAAYEKVGSLNKPVILFWGREDQVVPFEHHEKVQAAIPGVQFHPIDNVGHSPQYETPEVVAPLLIPFLSES